MNIAGLQNQKTKQTILPYKPPSRQVFTARAVTQSGSTQRQCSQKKPKEKHCRTSNPALTHQLNPTHYTRELPIEFRISGVILTGNTQTALSILVYTPSKAFSSLTSERPGLTSIQQHKINCGD